MDKIQEIEDYLDRCSLGKGKSQTIETSLENGKTKKVKATCYKFFAVHKNVNGSDEWIVTHLGTGLSVCHNFVIVDEAVAARYAAGLSGLPGIVDWNFGRNDYPDTKPSEDTMLFAKCLLRYFSGEKIPLKDLTKFKGMIRRGTKPAPLVPTRLAKRKKVL